MAPLVALLLALAPGASAQDDCSAASAVTLGQAVPFDTAGMTASPIQWSPWCGTVIRQDVWFSFQAPTSGTYLASACGSRDSSVELFAGTCAALERISCDRNRCRYDDPFTRGGKVYFRAGAGEIILARVGPTTSGVGDTWGNFTVTNYAAPAFDDCSTPMVLQEGASVFVEPFLATMDGPVPTCGSPYGSDVWFEFTPATSGVFEASTCGMLGGTMGSTSIGLYTGSCGVLTELGCRTSNCPSGTETIYSFTGTAGTRYLLRLVGSFSLLEGPFTLDRVGGNPADDCGNASTAPAPGSFQTVSLSGSTLSPEPWSCANSVTGDVWLRFVAQESALHQFYIFETNSGISPDLMVEVREGPCGSGQVLGCDVGSGIADIPSVTTFITAGTESFIRLGSDGPQSLDVTLRIVAGPENDRCEDATQLTEEVWTTFQTREPAQTASWMCGANFGGDLWFKVTPSQSRPYEIVVCEEFNQTDKVEVYQGSCGGLQFIGCTSDNLACFDDPLSFNAVAGTEYYIRVNGPNYDATAEILVSRGAPPINDECGGAIPLVPGDSPWTLGFSTYSASIPATCGQPGNQDVWFSYDSPRDSRVAISLCGRNASIASVYEGSCGALRFVECTPFDSNGVCSPGSPGPSFTFNAAIGQRYYLRIDGAADQRDVLTLIEAPSGPVGTPFCSASPNSTGQSSNLDAFGSPQVNVFGLSLEVSALPADVTCMVIVSQDQGFTPNAGGSAGNLCLGGSIGRYNRPGELFATNALGEANFIANRNAEINVPGNFGPLMAGDTWHFQVWHRDVVTGAATSNFTNGLTVLFL